MFGPGGGRGKRATYADLHVKPHPRIPPELDRLPTICRALTGFLGAYSRLPGPRVWARSGCQCRLRQSTVTPASAQPRFVTSNTMPRRIFRMGSVPCGKRTSGEPRPCRHAKAAPRIGCSRVQRLVEERPSWNDSQDPHGYKLVGTRRKETPIRIRVHHGRLGNSRFCLSRCGAHSRRSAPAKRR